MGLQTVDAFNMGRLPPDYYALMEPNGSGPIGDLPAGRFSEEGTYARKANRLAVRHRHGGIVAVVEIVSPGNKGSRIEIRAFVEKTAVLIRHDVHLLVVDLFPPGPRDPQGVHKLIWDEFQEVGFTLPPDMPLALAAYEAGAPRMAYVGPISVGDNLPETPLFLRSGCYVETPLEATYQATWKVFPAPLKGLLEGPAPQSPPGS